MLTYRAICLHKQHGSMEQLYELVWPEWPPGAWKQCVVWWEEEHKQFVGSIVWKESRTALYTGLTRMAARWQQHKLCEGGEGTALQQLRAWQAGQGDLVFHQKSSQFWYFIWLNENSECFREINKVISENSRSFCFREGEDGGNCALREGAGSGGEGWSQGEGEIWESFAFTEFGLTQPYLQVEQIQNNDPNFKPGLVIVQVGKRQGLYWSVSYIS